MKLVRVLAPLVLTLVASAAFTTQSLNAQSPGVYSAAQASAGALANFGFPNGITDAHNHEYLQTRPIYRNARHLQ